MAGDSLQAVAFFYAYNGIAGKGPDQLVLRCYELAKFYHVDPNIFLEKPLSEIQRHLFWTHRLGEAIAAEEDALRAQNER
jgi:hypothetical protein